MNRHDLLRNKIFYHFCQQRKQFFHILGIESSCDDAAISIVNFDERKVLADRRSSDFGVHARAGGVLPYASARHHRDAIPHLISECLTESSLRASDIDAVAVSSRPGLVICLKAGIHCALDFARSHRRPLIPVHHMRAHALTMRLLDPNLAFPFAVLLISGAHCLFCLVTSPFEFRILAQAGTRGSPGECLDKLAREMGIPPSNGHYGAALEEMAKKCSPQAYQNYKLHLRRNSSDKGDWDFESLKNRYLHKINSVKRKLKKAGHSEEEMANEIADLCAAVQESVVEHVCEHLGPALAFLARNVPEFIENLGMRNLVISGGVAANARFLEAIRQIAASHKFQIAVPPPKMCTDNGVMVAWTGAEIFDWIQNGRKMPMEIGRNIEHAHIYWPNELPDCILAISKAEIGPEIRWRKVENEGEENEEEKKISMQNTF